MMLGAVIIHIYWVFLYTTFQRMQLYGQNGHVSIVDIEEILLFKVVFAPSRLRRLRTHVTGQTGGRWPTNATKKKLIQGPVPTPYTIVPHSVWLTFHRRRMVRFKLLYISRA